MGASCPPRQGHRGLIDMRKLSASEIVNVAGGGYEKDRFRDTVVNEEGRGGGPGSFGGGGSSSGGPPRTTGCTPNCTPGF